MGTILRGNDLPRVLLLSVFANAGMDTMFYRLKLLMKVAIPLTDTLCCFRVKNRRNGIGKQSSCT